MSHFDRHFYRSQPNSIRHIPFAHDGLRPIDRFIGKVCAIGLVLLVVEQLVQSIH